MTILPAESVGLMRVELPVRGRRQRLQAVPFALEDRLSVPVESAHCALHPNYPGPDCLAAVLRLDTMPSIDRGGPVIAETMALPAPQAGPEGFAWSVWREGQRAVVRVSDGTGFAVQADALATLWRLAGRPPVTNFGAALPADLLCTDLSADPPPADAADLGFDLRQGAFATGNRHWPGTLKVAAVALGVGLLLHLAIAAADRMALSRIAAHEVASVEARLTDRLPGATLQAGLPALLTRLAPPATAPQGSALLSLLGQMAEALLADAPPVTGQRLTWDARSGELVMSLSAGTLDDLQAIERSLASSGLQVTSGVATAGDGAARADIRVSGAP